MLLGGRGGNPLLSGTPTVGPSRIIAARRRLTDKPVRLLTEAYQLELET